ncbi:MAG TPA: GNAT family N-acetyltransferase [Blastocatellia bacterium]
MTIETVSIRPFTGEEAGQHCEALSEILIDCVEGGASVGFMVPLSRDKARAFWLAIAEGVASGQRALLVAQDCSSGTVIGTVQIVLAQHENQPHRADVSKMLVHRGSRRHGVGARLMLAAEEVAKSAGKTLLVLDTASSDAERLYERLGWIKVGVIPEYALWPEGGLCATTYYYKKLA